MSKYYVSCGDVRSILQCDSARDAAIRAIFLAFAQPKVRLHPDFVFVSQHGFDCISDDEFDLLFATREVLAAVGEKIVELSGDVFGSCTFAVEQEGTA